MRMELFFDAEEYCLFVNSESEMTASGARRGICFYYCSICLLSVENLIKEKGKLILENDQVTRVLSLCSRR